MISAICVLQALTIVLLAKLINGTEEPRNFPKGSNLVHDYKDIADQWIGFPKSPYESQINSYQSVANPSYTTTTKSTTSHPTVHKRTTQYKKKKKKKHRKNYEDYDTDIGRSEYLDTYYGSRYDDRRQDDNMDYDDGPPYYPSKFRNMRSPFMSGSSPAESYRAKSSAAKPSIITPKIARVVVHEPKHYFVKRLEPEAIFTVKPNGGSDLFASGSTRIRRVDPLDYDDNTDPVSSVGFGPQSGFPPRQVMDKIRSPGDRQPCHGPECHQHHKGLVRFYWKRVIYPNEETGGSRRRPGRNRGRRLRNRRFRDRQRAPSDNKVTLTGEPVNDDDDDEDEDDDDDDQDEAEQSNNRREMWHPGRAYGHDLDEGENYTDNEKKIYRDKRYAFKKWLRTQKQ